MRGFQPRRKEKKAGDYAIDASMNMIRTIYGGGIAQRFVDALRAESKSRLPDRDTPDQQIVRDAVEAVMEAHKAIGSEDEVFKSGPRKGKRKQTEYTKQALESAAKAIFTVTGVPKFPFYAISGLLRESPKPKSKPAKKVKIHTTSLPKRRK